jgi:hypothetical protein
MTKFYSFVRPIWMATTVATLFFAGYAGVEAGPLATTDSAFFGVINNEDGLQNGHDGGYWRGTETLLGDFATFTATVDFAVFAPGASFGDFLSDEYGLSDPTSGFEWVYAFQTTGDGSDFPGGDVSRLNAGYDAGEIVTGPAGSGPGFPPGEVALAGGVTTTSSLLQGSSSDWLWDSGLADLENSNILYYTSAFAPKKDKVTVLSAFDSKTSEPQDFASPSNVIHDFEIPEPTSLALAVSLFTILVSGRRRRS